MKVKVDFDKLNTEEKLYLNHVKDMTGEVVGNHHFEEDMKIVSFDDLPFGSKALNIENKYLIYIDEQKYRGKTLEEWREYIKKDQDIGIRTSKYILVLEEIIQEKLKIE